MGPLLPKSPEKWERILPSNSNVSVVGAFSDSSHRHFISIHKTISYFISYIVISVGCLGLSGWVFNLPVLKSIVPGLATMKVNTALSFILSGISLSSLGKEQTDSKTKLIAWVGAVGVTAISLITLVEYSLGWDIGIDQLLFHDFDTPAAFFPGRMSPATAFCFFLTGDMLLLLHAKQDLFAQIFALMTGFVALLALIGYMYDVNSLYRVFIYSSMALHTATSFLLLAWSALFARPSSGIMPVITSNTVGGIVARRLLPAAVIIPLTVGAIILVGQRIGGFDANFGLSLFVLSTIVILCALIFGNARFLYDVDIERNRIVKALEQAEEKYHSIFENAVEGIYQSLPSGQIMTANPAMARMLRYESSAELTTADMHIAQQLFISHKSYDEFMRRFEEKGFVEGFEVQLRCKDGSRIWALMNMRGIKDKNKQLLYYEGSIVNISERKQVAEERMKLEAQLYQSQKTESLGRLAGGVAHDFNNLLVPIMGYVELGMMKLSTEDKLYTDLMRIGQAAKRAASLTRQILAFSRQQMLEMQVLDLNVVINEFQEMFRRLVREDVQLRITLTSSPYPIKADRGQIEQVLMNLIVNACDAMPDGGKLTIETANVFFDEKYVAKHTEVQPGPHVMLAISDNGNGIDVETQKHIFDPFFTTKERGKGTGLGLATVLGIVKQHQGYIWVYSEPDNGTTFKIYLPQSTGVMQTNVSVSEEPVSDYGTETVLVAEDEEMVRKLLCETLEAYGYHVLETTSPEHCLQLAADYQDTIHLLLTDVIMPKMNGRELHQELDKLYPGIGVLYISGYTDNVIIHHNILDEGVNFLQKPFTIRHLMQKVRKALG